MKNSVFLIVLFFLAFEGFAQENKFGFRLGIGGLTPSQDIGPWQNASFLSVTGNSEPFNQQGGIGFRGGFLVDVYLTEIFRFQPELLFTSSSISNTRPSKNAIVRMGEEIMLEEEEIIYALRYIELPLLLKCKVYRKWSILTGLSPSINVYSKVHMNYWEPTEGAYQEDFFWRGRTYTAAQEETEKYDFDYANKFLLNAVVEINYKLGRIGFVFLNYSGSLSNIYEVDELDGFNMESRIQSITFGFGGLF